MLRRTIRLAEPADAVGILRIYAPIVETTATSFELDAPSLADMQQRITHCLSDRPWLVCAAGNGVLGYAYASAFRTRAAYRWSTEVSVYVREDQFRKGVGRALYTSLFECLRVQGYRTLVAGITLPNAASVALHERLGFEPVGVFRNVGFKFGAWRDVGWWQRALQPAMADPPEVRPLPQLWQQGEFLAALSAGEALRRE
ncbi:MAG: N-acetyltransferase [Planctomycetes bacterium]|nr:N-acetyltransferase [Planctomycetota bacterium]